MSTVTILDARWIEQGDTLFQPIIDAAVADLRRHNAPGLDEAALIIMLVPTEDDSQPPGYHVSPGGHLRDTQLLEAGAEALVGNFAKNTMPRYRGEIVFAMVERQPDGSFARAYAATVSLEPPEKKGWLARLFG